MRSEPSESSVPLVEPAVIISDATLISRSSNALAAELDGELLMMSLETGVYFSLNEVGSDIWRRIEPACSFADLIDNLAVEYDADRATIAEHVRAWLAQMATENIVKLA